MSTPEDLLLTVIEEGIEAAFRRYYGLYRGVVKDNKDPDGRGRVQVQVFDVGHEESTSDWISPIFPMAGANKGQFYPPDIGDTVRVVYWAGDVNRPLAYVGGWYGEGDLPEEFALGDDKTPYVRGFMSRLGHSLLFSDEPGNEFLRLTWHQPKSGDPALSDSSKTASRGADGKYSILEFTKDGGLNILVNSGDLSLSWNKADEQFLILDKNGNSLTIDPDGIKLIDSKGNSLNLDSGKLTAIVDGSINIMGKSLTLAAGGVNLGSPAPMSAVLGEPLLVWLASHTHAGVTPGPGVCGPPVVPPTPVLLSKSVKLKL